MFKKKYHGGLKVLLLLLFIMLLGMFSTVYASTNITSDYIKWSIQNIIDNGSLGTKYNQDYKNSLTSLLNQNIEITILDNISDMQENNNLNGLSNVNLCVVPEYSSSFYYFYLHFIISNSGAPDGHDAELSFLNLKMNSRVGLYGTGSIYDLSMRINSNGSYTFTPTKRTSYIDFSSFGTVTSNSDNSVVYIQNISFADIPLGYMAFPLTSSRYKCFACCFSKY